MHDHNSEPGFTRRDFLRQAGLVTLAGLAGCQVLEAGAAKPFSAGRPLATVVLVRDQNALGAGGTVNAAVVQRMLGQGLLALTGEKTGAAAWRHFVKSSDTVGVKYAHCSWMRVWTHPEVIDAVASGVRAVGVPSGKVHREDGGLPVPDCTALINAASLKAHPLTGFAAALKSYINFSDKPDQYHDAGSKRLPEVWLRPEVKGKTRLIVIDLLTPYFGTGPQIDPRYQADYRGLLLATDPVAADTVALHLCLKLRESYRKRPWPLNPPPLFLEAADKQYHLGTSDPTRIKLVRLGWTAGVLV